MNGARPAGRKPPTSGAAADGRTLSAASQSTRDQTARSIRETQQQQQQQPLSKKQRRQKTLDSLTQEVSKSFPSISSSLSGGNIKEQIKFLELIKQVNETFPRLLSQNPGGEGTIAEKIKFLELIKQVNETFPRLLSQNPGGEGTIAEKIEYLELIMEVPTHNKGILYQLNPDEEHVFETTAKMIQAIQELCDD